MEVNRTFCAWTSHTREQLLGDRRFQDLLSAPGRIYHETHFAPLLHMQDEVSEIALEVVQGDGSRLPVLVNARLSRDAEGRPEQVRIAVFKALDRRRYERELLVAQRRERAARDRTERLQRLTSRLAAAADLESIGELLVAEMTQAGLTDAAVALCDPEQPPRVLAGPAAEPPAAALASLRGGLPVFSDGRALVPLVSAERSVGVAWGRAAEPLGEDERVHVEACAGQCALALERARLYERERTVAHVLQVSLLAGQAPDDPRCSVTTHYQPGVGTLEVGGDFYDSFLVSENVLGLAVGDVVGHGLSAATGMGQLRSALRALAVTGPGPSRVLQRLDTFVERVPAAEGATVVYVEVDLSSGEARYACAGHPPPLLTRPGDAPCLLSEGRSIPLGYFAPAKRPEGLVTLEPGDRLLLYTDGLVETRRESIDVGLERLSAAVRRAPGRPPGELAQELIGDAPHDDVCLLAFELRASA